MIAIEKLNSATIRNGEITADPECVPSDINGACAAADVNAADKDAVSFEACIILVVISEVDIAKASLDSNYVS